MAAGLAVHLNGEGVFEHCQAELLMMLIPYTHKTAIIEARKVMAPMKKVED